MKNTKKFAAMIAALTLSACSIAPMFSFAADGDTNPGVSDNNSEANGKTTFNLATPTLPAGASITAVNAYKIFDISVDEKTKDVSVTDWATAVDTTVQDKLIKAAGLESGTASDVAAKLSALNKDASTNAAAIEAFAKIAANALVVETAIGTFDSGIVTFSGDGLANGYYVFTCTVSDGKADSDYDSLSLGMLTVADGVNTTIGKEGVSKVGLPSVMKKVLEDDNGATDAAKIGDFEEETVDSKNKWNDGADWAIGQKKSFKLYGTLPDNYDEYNTYKYVFHDSLATQFDDPTNFVVVADGQTLTADTDYTVSAIETKDGKKEFSVSFSNLKSIKKTGTEDALINNKSVITVQYDTALNSTAIVGGNGQQNEVYLEYSNNPNKSGSGDTDNTGKTPEDKVVVFTYALEFNKTFFEGDSDLTEEEIVNGTYDDIYFTLKDKDGNTVYVVEYTGEDAKYDYVIVKDDKVSGATSNLKLTLVDQDGNEKTKPSNVSDVAEGDKLVIRIKGLDSGEYKINESVESGKNIEYNTVSDVPANIKTGVTYQQAWDDFQTNGIFDGNITYNFGDTTDKTSSTATANGTIKNTKGSKLPSTGGIGTTIFYLGGGAMVAVAGVFLITKKRMGKSEN